MFVHLTDAFFDASKSHPVQTGVATAIVMVAAMVVAVFSWRIPSVGPLISLISGVAALVALGGLLNLIWSGIMDHIIETSDQD